MKTEVIRKRTYAVRAALCVVSLFLCAQPGKAQNTEIPPVPDGLADSLKTILAAERQELVDEEARVRASVVEHDGQCRQVTAGSAMASTCAARRDSLRSAAAMLRQEKEKFSNAVIELNRLIAEESTLSQAIRAAVERMRGMLDEVTEAGQEQLSVLSEQLKNQLAARRQFRVRKETIVLGVRG